MKNLYKTIVFYCISILAFTADISAVTITQAHHITILLAWYCVNLFRATMSTFQHIFILTLIACLSVFHYDSFAAHFVGILPIALLFIFIQPLLRSYQILSYLLLASMLISHTLILEWWVLGLPSSLLALGWTLVLNSAFLWLLNLTPSLERT